MVQRSQMMWSKSQSSGWAELGFKARACLQGSTCDCQPTLLLPCTACPSRSPALHPVVKAGPFSETAIYLLLLCSFRKSALATVLCIFVFCHVPSWLGLTVSPLHPTCPSFNGHFGDDHTLYCAPVPDHKP